MLSEVRNPNSIFWEVASVTPAAAAAVPEPASWALMIAGFSAAGVALRRRRVAVAFG